MKNLYLIVGLLCFWLGASTTIFAQNTPCAATAIQLSTTGCHGSGSTAIDLGNTSSSGIGDPGGCGNNVFSNPQEDGWATVTVPAGETILSLDMSWSGCSTFFCTDNPGWAVYSGTDCNTLSPILCGGDNGLFPPSSYTVTITDLEEGDVVYIRVWETDNQNSDVSIDASFVPENDRCVDALPLQGTGCNYGATNTGEPDSWTPGINACAGTDGWSSNENGVWYTFTVDAATPQPVSIDIINVVCDNTGGANMQMGVWTNNGTCDLNSETMMGCAVGVGTVTFGPANLPQGDYYIFVDGNAGANCEWEFLSSEVLPIELGDFWGNLIGQEAFLKWETFSEMDNEHFDVQHSTNGHDFTSIGRVEGIGNTNDRQEYGFTHRNLAKGDNYYRLTQVDFDGQSTTSETIVLTLKAPRVIGVYPNPVIGQTIHMDVEGFSVGKASFQLLDAAGRMVYSLPFDYAGEPSLTFDLPAISQGVYFYSVTLNERGYHGKLIK